MESQLSLSLIEIIVLMLGAITLGITIHFFITSRRSLRSSSPQAKEKVSKELEEWKLRYLNDIEWRDKELVELKRKLDEERDNNSINVIEAEEMRKENKELRAAMSQMEKTAVPATEEKGSASADKLLQAQATLKEYNDKIQQLFQQFDLVKETEEKQKMIERENEELLLQVEELKLRLNQKDREVSSVRQKQELTSEMSSMLDNAMSEFSVLQEKIHKLEQQVAISKRASIEFEEVKEENFKNQRDLEEERLKRQAVTMENNELQAALAEAGEKLREANFQRQQLQKKVAFLEEVNNDMQAVTEANKKLESQIKRIGELESMLNLLEEEKRKH